MGETGEVISHTRARDIDLPGVGTFVLLTLDNERDHTRPATLGPRTLAELYRTLVEQTARADIVGLGVTGKPFGLAAGADLGLIGNVQQRSDALMIARMGHAAYHLLHTAEVPTFCFINGLALGGGLEIGLHCDYRTVSRAVPAVALPETFLGLVPGWGGAHLVPRLIGPKKAVQVIITNAMNRNRTINGPTVFDLGLADVLLDGADFLERSLLWAAQVISGEVTVARQTEDDPQVWDAAVAEGRAIVDGIVHGAAPAPYRALDRIAAARTETRAEAYRAEDEALADLIMGEELRASLYAFDLTQKRARKAAGAPDKSLARPVTKVGVVGAGLMATQLATLFVRRLGVPVVMSDLDAERAERGVRMVREEFAGLHEKGRLSADDLNRLSALISGTTDQADFADCSFVIEAVFEEMSVKKEVFAEVARHVPEDCVLATNTSSLSVTEMSEGLPHPERVVGFHFFNPVAVLPLLEVVKTPHTDDATLATALAVAKELRKNAVLVADSTAFVVNRVLVRMMSELTKVVDEGTPIEVADRALQPLGLPMTPFELLELVGPAIALHVAESLNASFGDRFHVSPNLQALVAAKRPGIYDRDEHGAPYVGDEVRALFEIGDSPSTSEQVRTRIENALAEEIRMMLDEGVVEAPMDIDLCMMLGAGWPFHLGGITPYLDRAGVSERVTGQRFLPTGVAGLPE
ncbi:MAG: 3-hydroxyacyl-CoA dehydrogenase [Propionibacterium sp.]|nr:3-hydroxyacyl-CoA dehydrogenase [Propionibacterium sp.]